VIAVSRRFGECDCANVRPIAITGRHAVANAARRTTGLRGARY